MSENNSGDLPNDDDQILDDICREYFNAFAQTQDFQGSSIDNSGTQDQALNNPGNQFDNQPAPNTANVSDAPQQQVDSFGEQRYAGNNAIEPNSTFGYFPNQLRDQAAQNTDSNSNLLPQRYTYSSHELHAPQENPAFDSPSVNLADWNRPSTAIDHMQWPGGEPMQHQLVDQSNFLPFGNQPEHMAFNESTVSSLRVPTYQGLLPSSNIWGGNEGALGARQFSSLTLDAPAGQIPSYGYGNPYQWPPPSGDPLASANYVYQPSAEQQPVYSMPMSATHSATAAMIPQHDARAIPSHQTDMLARMNTGMPLLNQGFVGQVGDNIFRHREPVIAHEMGTGMPANVYDPYQAAVPSQQPFSDLHMASLGYNREDTSHAMRSDIASNQSWTRGIASNHPNTQSHHQSSLFRPHWRSLIEFRSIPPVSEPEPVLGTNARYTNSFESFDAAHDYFNGPDNFTQLDAIDDDWEEVRDQRIQFYAQQIFHALAHQYKPPAKIFNDKQATYYDKAQQKALGYVLKALINKPLDVEAQVILLLEQLLLLHARGANKAATQKSKLSSAFKPELKLRCSERAESVIELVKNSKHVAKDVVQGVGLADMVLSPATYVARKEANARSNSNKKKNGDSKEKKVQSVDSTKANRHALENTPGGATHKRRRSANADAEETDTATTPVSRSKRTRQNPQETITGAAPFLRTRPPRQGKRQDSNVAEEEEEEAEDDAEDDTDYNEDDDNDDDYE